MLARYIGLSNETPYGVMKFLELSRNFELRPKILTVQNSYNLLCRNFDAGLAECCHHERISLLAYSPMAMGILSGKYHSSDDSGLPDARMNLFKGAMFYIPFPLTLCFTESLVFLLFCRKILRG